jgi:Pvc16 N-terminal domain
MASYPAIAAMSQAVLGLLRTAAIGGEFDGVEFTHYGSGSFQTPMSLGVSLYLYRVSVSPNRNLPWRIGAAGRRYRPPIQIDAHVLLTAWAGDPIKPQRMLGFAIRTLEDTPILPAGALNQRSPEQQPSATYVARMIEIESSVAADDAAPAETRQLDLTTAVDG